MGRSRTVTFTVTYKLTDLSKGLTPSEWKVKVQGKPTVENLRKDVAHFEASCQPGGCNEHLGPMKVKQAYIIDQRVGEIVADVVLL